MRVSALLMQRPLSAATTCFDCRQRRNFRYKKLAKQRRYTHVCVAVAVTVAVAAPAGLLLPTLECKGMEEKDKAKAQMLHTHTHTRAHTRTHMHVALTHNRLALATHSETSFRRRRRRCRFQSPLLLRKSLVCDAAATVTAAPTATAMRFSTFFVVESVGLTKK